MTPLEDLHNEIDIYIKGVGKELSLLYDAEEVRTIAGKFLSAHEGKVSYEALRKEFDEETFYMGVAMWSLRLAQESIPPTDGTEYTVTADNMASIATHMFNAAGALAVAGFDPFKKEARSGETLRGLQKGTRMDKLREAMIGSWNQFKEKHGRYPTAQELWDAIPTDGKYIQDKDDEVIWWRNPSGSEKSTSFASFEDRLTRLKKNNLV